MKTISVTVVSTVTTTTDDGDSSHVTIEVEYDGCLFAPRSSSERNSSRSPAVITGATLYREGGLPVDADDEIRISGVSPQVDGTWQVEGAPGDWGVGVEVAITRTGDL